MEVWRVTANSLLPRKKLSRRDYVRVSAISFLASFIWHDFLQLQLLYYAVIEIRLFPMANSRPGGGGNLSFQDTGLCHSNRKSTTHKSGEISQKYTHKSGEFSENHTHKSGKCTKLLKNIPINLENAKNC